MKNILLYSCLLVPSALFAQGTQIKGHIAPLKNPKALVYLQYGTGNSAVSDSVNITNGQFEFNRVNISNASKAMLIISPDGVPLSKFSQSRMNKKTSLPPDYLDFFIANNGDKIVLSSTDSLKNAKISGSQLNVEYKNYQEQLKSTVLELGGLTKKVNALSASQRKDNKVLAPFENRRKELVNELAQKNLQYANTNTNSYFSLLALMEYLRAHPNEAAAIAPAFNKLNPKIKEEPLAKMLLKTIDGAKETAIGSVIPNFQLNDYMNKPVSITDFRGTYTLIYFWASWCESCRDTNLDVLALYQEYKDKGFAVLGVSLDKEKNEWGKAVRADNLSFIQVSDLNGWENKVAVQFGIRRIPENILIDPNGKIIAKNLTTGEINETLTRVLSKK